MPSASTSTLRRPSASRSSLSHSMTVRSSIAAFSIGTTSSSRLRVMTKPPTCWDRWRGKPISSCASASTCLQPRIGRIEPGAARLLLRHAVHRPAPQRAGERADRVLGQAEDLADLADGAAAAIADHGRGQAGALAAVLLVDVLDDLFAPLVLEIDVDVGRLAALGGDEALEQQIDLLGIDLGDAEAITDDGIRRRAAALAQDAFRARAKRTMSWTVRKNGAYSSSPIRRSSWSSACRTFGWHAVRDSGVVRPPSASATSASCGVA